MRKSLVFLGAGGNAYDLIDTVEAINAHSGDQWHVLGFLDDYRPTGSSYLQHKILGKLADACLFPDAQFASSIWNEKVHGRLGEILNSCELAPDRFATLVHPGASVSARAKLGLGVLVHFGASIGGAVVVSDLVSIGPGVVIGHQTALHSYSCLAAGAVVSGGVVIEDHCYVGSGASIKQGIRVGARSVIGLGAVVVKDVPRGSTVVGNPARELASLNHGPTP